jgi:hypothetical protein
MVDLIKAIPRRKKVPKARLHKKEHSSEKTKIITPLESTRP